MYYKVGIKEYSETKGRVTSTKNNAICVLYEVGEHEYFLTETLEYKEIKKKIFGFTYKTIKVPKLGKLTAEGSKVTVMVNMNDPIDAFIDGNNGDTLEVKHYWH